MVMRNIYTNISLFGVVTHCQAGRGNMGSCLAHTENFVVQFATSLNFVICCRYICMYMCLYMFINIVALFALTVLAFQGEREYNQVQIHTQVQGKYVMVFVCDCLHIFAMLSPLRRLALIERSRESASHPLIEARSYLLSLASFRR